MPRHVGDAKLDVSTGYFMLRQKRFVTGAQGFDGSVVAVEGESPRETWTKIETSWRATMEELAGGAVRAPSIRTSSIKTNFDDPVLMTPPNCNYCDFAIFAGENDEREEIPARRRYRHGLGRNRQDLSSHLDDRGETVDADASQRPFSRRLSRSRRRKNCASASARGS